MLCVRQIILNHRCIVVTRFIAAKQPVHQVKPIDLAASNGKLYHMQLYRVHLVTSWNFNSKLYRYLLLVGIRSRGMCKSNYLWPRRWRPYISIWRILLTNTNKTNTCCFVTLGIWWTVTGCITAITIVTIITIWKQQEIEGEDKLIEYCEQLTISKQGYGCKMNIRDHPPLHLDTN
jgi:hypothetical protein